MSRTAIIGAGVTGVLTAYQMQRLGHQVCLFDRNPGAAMDTSFANGGQISVSNAEVWNNWHTVWTGLLAMFGADAPLRVGMNPNWHKLSWFCAFAREGLRQQENTERLVRMALYSRACLQHIATRENIAFDRRDTGLMHVYATRAQFSIAERANRLLNTCGLERRAVTSSEIREIEPALSGEYYGGFFTPGDFSGDVHKFARALLDICKRRGVEICFGTDVRTLAPANNGATITLASGESITFDNVIICAGVGSRKLARMAGDRVNVYPVKGYSLTIDIDPATTADAAPETALLDEAAKIVTSRLGNRVRIAGLAEFRGYDLTIDPARVRVLERWAAKHFPGLKALRTEAWTGLRPMMPSMTPMIGPGRHKGIFYNTGHGHLGWTLSAGTADILAGVIGAA